MSTNTASHLASQPSSSSKKRKLPFPRVHMSFPEKDSDWTPTARVIGRPRRGQDESSHSSKSLQESFKACWWLYVCGHIPNYFLPSGIVVCLFASFCTFQTFCKELHSFDNEGLKLQKLIRNTLLMKPGNIQSFHQGD